MGTGKCLDTITPEATISHGLCISLQPNVKALTLGASDTSEVNPDFGKRFVSRCSEDAGRFWEFLHCFLNLFQLQWMGIVELVEPRGEK